MADFNREKNKGALPPPLSPPSGNKGIPLPAGPPLAGIPGKITPEKKKNKGEEVLDSARKRLEELLKSRTQEQQSKWKEVVDTLYEENKLLKDRMSSNELEQKMENDKKEMELRMYREDVDRKIGLMEEQLKMERKKVSEQESRIQQDQKTALKVEVGLREVLEKSNREKDIKKLKNEREKLYNEVDEYRNKVDSTVEEMKLLRQKQDEDNIRWGEEINEKNAEVIAIKAQLKSRETDLEKLQHKHIGELSDKEKEIDKMMEKLNTRVEVEKKHYEEELGKHETSKEALIVRFTAQAQGLEKSLKNSEEKRLLAEAFQARSEEQKAVTDKLFGQISGELKKREEENNSLRFRMNDEINALKNGYQVKEQAISKEKLDIEYRLKIIEKEMLTKQKAYDDNVKLSQSEYEKREKNLHIEIDRLRGKLEEEKTVSRQQISIAEKQMAAMQEKADKSKQDEESSMMKLMDVKKEMAETNEQLQAQLHKKGFINEQMTRKLTELQNSYSSREGEMLSERTRLESRLKELQERLEKENSQWKEKLKENKTEKLILDDSFNEVNSLLKKREKEFKTARNDMEEMIANLEYKKNGLERELSEERRTYDERTKIEEAKFQAMINASKQKEAELYDRIKKLNERVAENEEVKTSAEQFARHTSKKIKAREREIEYFEQEVKELESRIEEERSAWKSRLNNAVKEKNIIKEELSRREGEFRNERDEMLKSVEETKARLETSLHNLGNEHENEKRKLIEKLSNTRDAHGLLSLEISKKEAELKSENRRLKDELETQKRKAQVLISAVRQDESVGSLDLLKKQEEEWGKKIEEREKEKLEADNIIARINQQLEEAKKQLKEHEEKNKSILQGIEQKESLIGALKSDMQKDEKDKLEERQKLEEEVKAYRGDLKKKEEEYTATKAKLKLELNILKSQKKKEGISSSGLEKETEALRSEWEVKLKNAEDRLEAASEDSKKLKDNIFRKENEIKSQLQQRDDKIKDMKEQLSMKEVSPDIQKMQSEFSNREDKLKLSKKRLEDELEEQSTDAEALYIQLRDSMKKKQEEIKSLKQKMEEDKTKSSKVSETSEIVGEKTETVKPVSEDKKGEVKPEAGEAAPGPQVLSTSAEGQSRRAEQETTVPEMGAANPEAGTVKKESLQPEPEKAQQEEPVETEAGNGEKKIKLRLEPRKISLVPPKTQAKPGVKAQVQAKPKAAKKKNDEKPKPPIEIKDKTNAKKEKKKKEKGEKKKKVKKEKKTAGKTGKNVTKKFWDWLKEPVHK